MTILRFFIIFALLLEINLLTTVAQTVEDLKQEIEFLKQKLSILEEQVDNTNTALRSQDQSLLEIKQRFTGLDVDAPKAIRSVTADYSLKSGSVDKPFYYPGSRGEYKGRHYSYQQSRDRFNLENGLNEAGVYIVMRNQLERPEMAMTTYIYFKDKLSGEKKYIACTFENDTETTIRYNGDIKRILNFDYNSNKFSEITIKIQILDSVVTYIWSTPFTQYILQADLTEYKDSMDLSSCYFQVTNGLPINYLEVFESSYDLIGDISK